MKKLMITAAAVAMTAGAFASPLVYDYKASAKHMYLKEVTVRLGNASQKVYQKYVKSASLKGYLIVDADGATSPAIQADAAVNNPDAVAAGITGATAPAAVDYGRNRAFLVVQNSKAESKVRFPKLIPAVLDAKWMDTKLKIDANGRVASNTGLTEGYLYAGGDCVVGAQRPAVDLLYPVGGNDVWAERAVNPAKAFIGDYAWQSIWLFGQYNMPLGLVGMYDVSQAAIDAVEPIPSGFAAGRLFFHDTWLNGAGFGKYTGLTGDKYCCGYAPGDDMVVLQSLSGNLKGGLYLCTENGTFFRNNVYAHLAGEFWEDQFFTKHIGDASGTWGGDAEPQTDLWQDGDLELNTSDCVSGTWSIKYTSRDLDAGVTQDDLNKGLGLAVGANWQEDALGLEELLGTIKGAALSLNSRTIFANNKEIFNYTTKQIGALTQVPLMTPAFAAYYGFLNFK